VSIIPDRAFAARDCYGVVLSLDEFDGIYASSRQDFLFYSRVTSRQQAGPKSKGMPKLKAKTAALRAEAERLVPDRVLQDPVFQDQEEGRLSDPRRCLVAAAAFAAEHGLALLAYDLSRFLRAWDYHRTKNPEAWPTPGEFAGLRELTLGVPLVTVADPRLTEAERHARRMKRAEGCGRPQEISPQKEAAILAALGRPRLDRGPSRVRWQTPIEAVAGEFGVSVGAVKHFLRKPSADGTSYRARAYARALREAGVRAD
jgi:hypothetical protein